MNGDRAAVLCADGTQGNGSESKWGGGQRHGNATDVEKIKKVLAFIYERDKGLKDTKNRKDGNFRNLKDRKYKKRKNNKIINREVTVISKYNCF